MFFYLYQWSHFPIQPVTSRLTRMPATYRFVAYIYENNLIRLQGKFGPDSCCLPMRNTDTIPLNEVSCHRVGRTSFPPVPGKYQIKHEDVPRLPKLDPKSDG